MKQHEKTLENEDNSKYRSANEDSLKDDSSSSSDSDKEIQKKPRQRRNGMPLKRFRRIFVGLGVTLLVVSPILVAMILLSLYNDSIKYVFHQPHNCLEKQNELRVVQVSESITVYENHANEIHI